MENSDDFSLDKAIGEWEKISFSQNDLTPKDKAEFKDHILNTIDELIDKGLSEEEAFIIAKMRFGDKDDWGNEMQIVNEKNFQLKKIVVLFSGVFAFVFSYYFILCLNKILFLVLYSYSLDAETIIDAIKIFFNIVCLTTTFLFVAIYFLHRPVIWLLNKFNLSLRKVILFILIMFSLIILEWYLVTVISGTIGDVSLRNTMFYVERNFKYYFVIILGIGYILIFNRYNKIFNTYNLGK